MNVLWKAPLVVVLVSATLCLQADPRPRTKEPNSPPSSAAQSQTGADEFQLEISPDRTFKNRALIKIIGPIPSTAPGGTGVVQTFNVPAFVTISSSGVATGPFNNKR